MEALASSRRVLRLSLIGMHALEPRGGQGAGHGGGQAAGHEAGAEGDARQGPMRTGVNTGLREVARLQAQLAWMAQPQPQP